MERGSRWWSPANRLEVEVLAATDWCVTFRLRGRDETLRPRRCRLDRTTFERAYRPCPDRGARDGAAPERIAATHQAERAA
jgi:hypothetical protein